VRIKEIIGCIIDTTHTTADMPFQRG